MMNKVILMFFLIVSILFANTYHESTVAPLSNSANIKWLSIPTKLKTTNKPKTENFLVSFEMIEVERGSKFKYKLEDITPENISLTYTAGERSVRGPKYEDTNINYNNNIKVKKAMILILQDLDLLRFKIDGSSNH